MTIEDKVEVVRTRLIVMHSFFGSLLAMLRVIPSEKDGMTLAGSTIYYNAEFIENHSLDELTYAFLHMLMHFAYKTQAVMCDKSFPKRWKRIYDTYIDLQIEQMARDHREVKIISHDYLDHSMSNKTPEEIRRSLLSTEALNFYNGDSSIFSHIPEMKGRFDYDGFLMTAYKEAENCPGFIPKPIRDYLNRLKREPYHVTGYHRDIASRCIMNGGSPFNKDMRPIGQFFSILAAAEFVNTMTINDAVAKKVANYVDQLLPHQQTLFFRKLPHGHAVKLVKHECLMKAVSGVMDCMNNSENYSSKRVNKTKEDTGMMKRAKDSAVTAVEINVANEILDNLTAKLKENVEQLENVNEDVLKVGVAFGLNYLMDHAEDMVPLSEKYKSALRGVVGHTFTAAFMPVVKKLNIFGILKSAVSCLVDNEDGMVD